jgi:SET domain-containing protein
MAAQTSTDRVEASATVCKGAEVAYGRVLNKTQLCRMRDSKSSWGYPMSQGKGSYAIKRTSTGLGFFARKAIPKGKRIIEYTGPLISNEEVERRSGKYFFGVNKKWSIDGSPRSNIARYINHSCTPNAEAILSGRRVWIWSKKNIPVGEEITYHYGKEYFEGLIEPIGCKCDKCESKSDQAQHNRTGARRAKHSR